MDIRGYLSPTQPLTLSATRVMTAQWQVGQLLQATVLSNPGAGLYVLRIGQGTVEARTTLQLGPGQALTLEVSQAGAQPVLKLVPAQVSDTLARALRTALPRQQPLAPLLREFAAAAQTPAAELPAAATRAVRHLLTQLTSLTQLLRPEGLQRAILNSGLYLEAKLAHAAATGTPPQTQEDFKANLLRLAAALSASPPAQAPSASALPEERVDGAMQPHPRSDTPAPPPGRGGVSDTSETAQHKLLLQTDAALARVQTQQARTLPHEHAGGQTWTIELPLRVLERVDTLQLQIQREDESGSCAVDARHRWSVWLSFDLEPIGALSARVSLWGEEVTASFWAARDETAELVQTHLRELESRFREAGLAVSTLSCVTGAPPHRYPAVMSGALVDVNA